MIDVFVSPSPAILSNCILPTFVKSESLRSSVPVTSKSPPTLRFCVNVTLPLAAIAIASVSEAEPICQPSAIVIPAECTSL